MIQAKCWCGNTELVPFSPEYWRCPVCESLVTSRTPAQSATPRVLDDNHDFYGRDYWFSYQEKDLGFPNIMVRSRTDLPERCLYWLRTVLKYKLPPASVLELGSAHGGFVAMLRWAGFEATGLELSPWVVEFARQHFGVPMLLGAIEDQQVEPGSLDMIALMDVLEHLPDPVGTMQHCLNLLKPDGVMIIQTPCYPEGKSYEEMVAEGNRFLEQLKADEHLYLFSRQSIREFFHRLGAEHLAFEPAIFAHYDMFLVVSRVPLAAYLPDGIAKALSATPNGRMIQALLDLDDQYRSLQSRYAELEADRAARLENLQRLERLLAEAERDRAARLGVIEAQGAEIARLQAEVHRWLEENKALWQQVGEMEAERNRLQAQLANLQRRLDESEAQRSRQAALGVAQQEQLQAVMAQLRTLQGLFTAIQRGRVYRVVRRLGGWKWVEQALSSLPSEVITESIKTKEEHSVTARSGINLKRVAVDLTPVLPGGENGGAKLVAIGLVRHLSQIAPDCEWVLLTSDKSHDELAYLDSHNVRRLCVMQRGGRAGTAKRVQLLKEWVRNSLTSILPPSVVARLKLVYRQAFHRPRISSLPRQIGADLVFCPFTAPFFYDPTVPMVIVVHDLQYLYYPMFFTMDERYYRDLHFRDSCRLASRIVCVSDYVRTTVLENADIDPNRVVTIYTRMANRLPQPDTGSVSVLKRLGIEANRFLLYPSNFWPHKNHEMLLTAFGLFRAHHPESDLRLVCTGAPGERMDKLQDVVGRMGLGGWVIFAGYVPDEELAALLQGCCAVIFPSLYEGFGMPILEAMAFGKPVLCSNVTALPEIAGDAALFFDPRKPQEIAQAIAQVESNPELMAQLVQRGYQRVVAFEDPTEMARQYLRVFCEALADTSRFGLAIHGIYPDGWTGERLTVTYDANSEERYLEISLTAPSWLPFDRVSVCLTQDGKDDSVRYQIERGRTLIVRRMLPCDSGFVELLIDPVFQPKAYNMGEDTRMLGCVARACRVVSPGGIINLLEVQAGHATTN